MNGGNVYPGEGVSYWVVWTMYVAEVRGELRDELQVSDLARREPVEITKIRQVNGL